MSSTILGSVCDRLAEQDLVLRKAIPRGPGHLLLELRQPDGSRVGGQWFADAARAGSVAATTAAASPASGVRLIGTSGIVIQPAGADRRLRTLPGLVADGGSTLVAHRPERRAVVRQLRPGGRVTFTKAVRRERLGDLLRPTGSAGSEGSEGSAGSAGIPGVRLPRVLAVDRAGATVTTESLPGRLLHDLLGDARVPMPSLTSAARAVGAAVARLHATPPPAQVGCHDAEAELSTTRRWWARAAAYRLLDLDGSAARDGFATARRLLAGRPTESVWLHRDLHDRQLLVTGAGAVGMLDFDLAAIGEPALDLANLLVHLDLRAAQGHCSAQRTEACGAALLDGYAPDATVLRRIPGYSLTTRLRLAAVYSFRPGGAPAARTLLTAGLGAAEARPH